METIASADGVNGQATIYTNRIDITRKGFKAFMSHGFDGTKSIFLSKLSGLQFKEAGNLTNGFIQFIFSGSEENKNGIFDATKDENTIMFDKKQQPAFEEIRNYIFSRIE